MYIGGSWNHDNNYTTPDVMAVFKNSEGSWLKYDIKEKPGDIRSLSVHPTDDDIIFAGGRDTEEWVGHLYKTNNGGNNWTEVAPSVFNNINCVHTVCFDPFNPDIIYVGTSSGLYISEDGGTNWDKKLIYKYITCFNTDPSAQKRLFAGTHDGVFISEDGGKNWEELNNGLVNTQVLSMDLDHENGYLYIGVSKGGVLRYKLAATKIKDPPDMVLPSSISLFQNFPNPFNAETVITYELPHRDQIKITIFDLRGRMVKTLQESLQKAGTHQVTWFGKDSKGDNAASGIYVIRLESSKEIITRKMIFQK